MDTVSRPSRMQLTQAARSALASRSAHATPARPLTRVTRVQHVLDTPVKARTEQTRNRIPTLAPSVNCRVLFVAQKSMHSQLIAMVLANENMTVRAVAEIQPEELQLAAGLPDLLLLDCDTPKVDFRATLLSLRARPETARVPVILLSRGAACEQVRRTFAPFGIHWILEKPIAALILPKLIRRTIKIAGQPQWPNGDSRYQRAELLAECGQTSCGAIWKAMY